MKFKTWIETTMAVTLYHGSTHEIAQFNDLQVGNGHDQEGPGIYLTDSEADAQYYARGTGFIYTVEANFGGKMVPTTGRPNRMQLTKILNAAPELDDALTDWDENPARAKRMVLDHMMNEAPNEAFQSVWYGFYRNNPTQFVRNMVSLGYDRVVIAKTNLNHYIVYNPAALRIVGKRPA